MNTQDFLMTKIIATLGPATNSVDIISKLIEAGARVFRINFSHGSFDEFDEMLDKIRKAEKKTNSFVAVLGDLSGPKNEAIKKPGTGSVRNWAWHEKIHLRIISLNFK